MKQAMKLALILGLLMGLAAALMGCAPAASSPEESFTNAVRADVADLAETSDRDIISLGVSICDSLELGFSEDFIIETGTDNGFTAREAEVVLVAAQEWICE